MKALKICFIYGLLFASLLIESGCSATGKVSPKPNIVPVQMSNKAARKSIGETRKEISETRKHIKSSKEASDKEKESLDVVGDDLNKLLNMPVTVPKK